jgi:hypothetical protein
MSQIQLAAVCGTYCGGCRFYQSQCAGCRAVKGKPFWGKEYKRDTCRLYDCCVNKKHLEHCGECVELPCQTFIDASDPAYTPEQADKNRNERIAALRARKLTLKDKE